MAKKGDVARQDVMDTIIKAFKDIDSYCCTADKKIYVWAQDGAGGEKLQFAVSITMPKTPVLAGGEVSGNEGAWSDAPKTGTAASSTASSPAPVELSAADKAKVQELMRRLNVS